MKTQRTSNLSSHPTTESPLSNAPSEETLARLAHLSPASRERLLEALALRQFRLHFAAAPAADGEKAQ